MAQIFLVVVFLAVVFVVPILDRVVDVRNGAGGRVLEVFHQKPTSPNLRAYERSLEEASVVPKAVRPWMQFVQFAWLRDGGEKALVGHDRWLFYKPGFDDMVSMRGGTPRGTNDPVAAIVAWRNALAGRGIHLLVVPAPNKESIYPDQLTRRAAPKQIIVSASTRDLLTRLKSADVQCVDLFGVFASARTNAPDPEPAPLYLAQDSHWSPPGVDLAARAVARRLLELGWIRRGDMALGQRPTTVERLGDVLRMLQSPPIERASALEKIPCVQVFNSETAELYRDDAQSEVLVLGDSFLRIFEQDEPGSAGFIAHLASELKRPLTSLVNDGGASTLVRQELYRRPALLKNKRVVVWEFVERDIRLGTEGWQHVPLPEETGATREASSPEQTPSLLAGTAPQPCL